MHRFFSNNINEITGSDARQIQKVLRAKVGDKIIVCDGKGKSYEAEITGFKKDTVLLNINEGEDSNPRLHENIEPAIKITLAQCLPKGPKMDFIIQKSVELGAFDIIPVISERSVPDLSGKEEKKRERWQKIAKEAAEQSGRKIIPQIHAPISFDDLLRSANKYDLKLILWELEKEKSLKSILSVQTCHGMSVQLIIGPEGGFSKNEIESAKSAGFISISLGKRILRTETAPIAILSNIFYELES